MSNEAAEYISEVVEALASLAELGFDLNNTMSMIYQDAIDKGMSPEVANAAVLFWLNNMQEELAP